MKNFLSYLFFIIILFTSKIYASGLSSWTIETPNGHELYYNGTSNKLISLYIGKGSISFKKFYFYKNHIIAHSQSEYYIINEKTEKVQKYSNEKIWNTQIKKQHLKPFFKREYDYSYSSFFQDAMLLIIVFFPFSLLPLLIWVISLISLLFSTKKFYSFRRHYSWIFPTIILLIFIVETNLQSF